MGKCHRSIKMLVLRICIICTRYRSTHGIRIAPKLKNQKNRNFQPDLGGHNSVNRRLIIKKLHLFTAFVIGSQHEDSQKN